MRHQLGQGTVIFRYPWSPGAIEASRKGGDLLEIQGIDPLARRSREDREVHAQVNPATAGGHGRIERGIRAAAWPRSIRGTK